MTFDFKILKKVRKRNGYTQGEVAEYLRNEGVKCERVTYTAWERGINPVSINHLRILAQLYKIDMSDFFAFSGNEKILQKGGDVMNRYKDQINELKNELAYYKGIVHGFRMVGHDVPPFVEGETSNDTYNGGK